MVAENNFVYSTYLNKSLYIKGLQCHKALWLHKYQPELKDEVSESQQAVFDSGIDIGILAQQLFPGGVEVPYDGLSHEEQIAMTKELIAGGERTIYEATFSFDDILVKVDILHHGSKGWELYEVKSSTKLKGVYLDDISVQCYVLAGCGIELTRTALVHINKRYVRQGAVEVDKLFTLLDVTGEVMEKQPELVTNIAAIRLMLQSDKPLIDIGPHCSSPYECSFVGHCWKHIPDNSVFEFRDIGRPDAFQLYSQGIIKMEDMPPDQLGWRQQLQLDGVLHRKNHVDTVAVREFLDSLWYPLYFLDFETTYMTPVPLFDGARPYQQIPFQFSMHIIPEAGLKSWHYEFLADGSADPRPEFVEQLLDCIPPNACILTWNKVFEAGRMRELADMFPEREHEITAVMSNLRDLMAPFREKSIYHWQFDGSYSLKAVLPALVPDLSYDLLEVCNGEMAAATWIRMIQMDETEEREALRRQLLEYCKLDTLAMVRILEEMYRMVE